MDHSHTIIRFRNLREHGITFSRPHINRLIKEGRFPPAIELSSMAIGWRLSDILAWLDNRPTRSREHLAETKAAIAEGQRRRWQRWRDERATEGAA